MIRYALNSLGLLVSLGLLFTLYAINTQVQQFLEGEMATSTVPFLEVVFDEDVATTSVPAIEISAASGTTEMTTITELETGTTSSTTIELDTSATTTSTSSAQTEEGVIADMATTTEKEVVEVTLESEPIKDLPDIKFLPTTIRECQSRYGGLFFLNPGECIRSLR